MSLQDSIERRRMAEPPAVTCVAPATQSPTLVLSTWRGESWALPWSYLESGQLVSASGDERIVLSFTRHEVTISGENLRRIWDDVTAFRAGCLRDLPLEYRARMAVDAPFITSIGVRDLTELNGRAGPRLKQDIVAAGR